MSILSSTNSGIHGIILDKEFIINSLKELGYDIMGSYYVSSNEKYKFLPNINLEDVYVKLENKTHFYINIIKTKGDQQYSFYHRYIINNYSDFLTFKKDITKYIDKYVNS